PPGDVTNSLPESTSIHWHGVLVPSGMDGVAGLSQKNIEPGKTHKYEFKLRQRGTYMYRSHSEMTDFNVLTFNGRSFPGTAPLVAKYGDRVRIRFGNLSPMEHHPIHLHGFYWKITEMHGLQVPERAQQPGSRVLVAVGQTRTVEFIADNPGDWAMHCHMTHHTMNQMGHKAPNLIGVRPGKLDKKVSTLLPGYMTMGESGMAD